MDLFDSLKSFLTRNKKPDLPTLIEGLRSDLIVIFTTLDSERKILMATLQQLLDSVTAQSSLIDSLSTMVQGLREQVNEVLQEQQVQIETQALISEIFDAAEMNKAKLVSALQANTQEATQEDPAPVVEPVAEPEVVAEPVEVEVPAPVVEPVVEPSVNEPSQQ